MNPEKQKEIARKGGRAAHEKGTAHEFSADEARAAGRKGGERVSADRSHMSRIGRLGGKSSATRRAVKSSPEGSESQQSESAPREELPVASMENELSQRAEATNEESAGEMVVEE